MEWCAYWNKRVLYLLERVHLLEARRVLNNNTG